MNRYRTKGSRLLDDVSPRLIPTKLACLLGVTKATLLQQIQYWVEHSGKDVNGDGNLWIYNSYEKWQEQFPFWGLTTIKEAFRKLKEQGLIHTGQFNKDPFDKTLWYRPDYATIDKLLNSEIGENIKNDQVARKAR